MGDDEERTLDFDSPVLRRGFTAVPNALIENTTLTIGARMTLVALMSFAWKGDPYPGQDRLASMLGVSDRTVRQYLSELQSMEFLKVTRRGSGRTNLYRISSKRVLLSPEDSSNGSDPDRKHTSGLDRKQASAPKEEDEVKKTKKEQAARKKNPVWDEMSRVFGEPTTKSAQTLRGKLVASLTRAGATPEEIVRRAKSWPNHFDTATLTAEALEKHWDTLGRKPLRRTR